ncbi:hypothetical protein M2226_009418 [Bradyrhizobium elkanii]|nr:hypothetical protein [Bradyrhizobium elkanii]MCW2175710.1 hypothetical protein [Bradyrhizobium elkanii]
MPGPDFCFIFAPGGYDEPEILPPQNPPVCLTGPDGEHRRACDALEFDRSTYHYKSRRSGQAALEQKIKEICHVRVRYGYRRVHVLLRREGWCHGQNKTRRIYRELGLQLRNKTPKRRVKAKLRDDRRPATRSNETWAMDFVHDQLATGHKLRVLTIIDTFPLPVGFVFESSTIVLDPDREVQGAVRTVFDLFAQEGTAFGVVQRFNALGLRFPRRAYGGAWDGKLRWGRLTHSRVLSILANPSYAGTYVFGRYQSSKHVGPSGDIRTRLRQMPQDAWRVMIQDHHVGYISWDQFVVNRDRLAKNRTNAEGGPSPAREGLCLLQGLLICEICGRRIGVRCTGNGGLYPMYQCVWKHRNALASRACLNVPSAPLDETIAERLVGAVTPVTLELALAALTSLEERDRQIGTQWRMRIDRARGAALRSGRSREPPDRGDA